LVESLIGVIVVVFIFFLLRRSTLAPIDAMLIFARRVAGGDLSGEVTVHARDELGQFRWTKWRSKTRRW
jgi:HAMP domain-containing protein